VRFGKGGFTLPEEKSSSGRKRGAENIPGGENLSGDFLSAGGKEKGGVPPGQKPPCEMGGFRIIRQEVSDRNFVFRKESEVVCGGSSGSSPEGDCKFGVARNFLEGEKKKKKASSKTRGTTS